ncbi:MAG TPA: serine hydrolase domain-containing protein [Opitutaceae bacterium]|nr:serine hydrolase domain-containing protein [Opitutaceae bacterium]
MRTWLVACVLTITAAAFGANDSPTARRARVEALCPEIDRIFREYAAERHIPGVVHGIVLDGELIHPVAFGAADTTSKRAVTLATRFRVASMSKSFTAMAILRLRDAGKLALADPVAKFLPEFARVKPLTTDAPEVRIEHLMTMLVGFPTDDPWGDRQLAMPVEQLKAFVAGGLSFSNTTGVAYEYSNTAYALLGQIVTNVSGASYQAYITRDILRPLGMKDTGYEIADVPAEQLALGYRWDDERWKAEPMLHDGTFGAMGGIITTLPDFARYAAFHLAAWPPRDADDRGPVRRATVREMHLVHGPVRILPESKEVDGTVIPATALGYGYGLISSRDARGLYFVRHSGGLPGFGSNYVFAPDVGVAVISFANRTYSPMTAVNLRVLRLLTDEKGLGPRPVPVSAILERRKQQVIALLRDWTSPAQDGMFADNLLLDQSREQRAAESRRLFAQAGAIKEIEPLVAENQMRGTFAFVCENGRVEVTLQLSPEAEPKIQTLALRLVGK